MTSSAQLELEAEQTRAQLARTLAELRERITPGQLLDQAVGYAKASGGGEFARKLGRQVAGNPLPVSLIGAGMAWLMLARGGDSRGPSLGEGARDQATDRMSDAAGRVGELAERTGAAATDATENAGRTIRETTSAAGESVRSLYDSARSGAAEAFESVSGTATRAGASAADAIAGIGPRTSAAASDLVAFCREQPLVTAALGLTIGAIIGALMPQTDAEDALMGDASDRLKRSAQEIANDEYGKAKSAVKSGIDEARAEAQRRGLGDGLMTEPGEATLVPADEHSQSPQPADPSERA